MPSALHDLARMTTATVGAGTITLGSAVSGYLSFAGAGVADGESVSYGITDGPGKEVGVGVYNAALQHLTRVVIASTNGGAPISLSGSAQVYLTPNSENVADKNGTGDQIFAGRVRTPSLIGQLAYGAAAPDSTFLPMDGETPLSQSAYAALYAQVGLEPIFTPSVKTLNPLGLVDIAYDGVGTYVGVSGVNNNNIFVSTDGGATWDLVNINSGTGSSGSQKSVAWCSGLGLFVLANDSTDLYTSPDGKAWTIRITGFDVGLRWVTCSGSRILAVPGNGADTDNSNSYAVTSDDAVTWTRRSYGNLASNPTCAHYCSRGLGLWLIGLTNGTYVSSPDAVTWTTHAALGNGTALLSFDDSASTIVGCNGVQIFYTTDSGTTWNNVSTAGVNGSSPSGVCYSPTQGFLVVGTNVQWHSPDGSTGWRTVQANIGTTAMLWDGTFYYVAGNQALLTRSADLVTWTPLAAPNGNSNAMNSGAYDGTGVRVMVGANGRIWRSANGTTWTEIDLSGSYAGSFQYVTWIADLSLFIAVGNSSGIYTSPDGTTWTQQTVSAGMTNPVAVAWSHSLSLAVMVGSTGHIGTSPDLVTWTNRTSNTGRNLWGVAWNGTAFCAVGTQGEILTSPDGVTWTVRVTPRGVGQTSSSTACTLVWVESDGASFYATVASSQTVGGATVLISADNGVTWTPWAAPAGLSHFRWLNGQLVGVCGLSNADILASANGKSWALKRPGVVIAQGKVIWDGAQYIFGVAGASVGGGSTQGGIGYSSDGIHVKLHFGGAANVQSPFTDVAYSASRHRLVAVGGNNIVIYSDDGGATWTRVFNVVTNQSLINTVTYSPSLDLFVMGVAANGTTNTYCLYTSADGGATWTHRAFSSVKLGEQQGSTPNVNAVIWAPAPTSLFVAVGDLGLIATSPDGVTWTERDGVTASTLNHVCHNAALGKFCAVSLAGFALTSADAITWTVVNAHVSMVGVASLEADGFLGTVGAPTNTVTHVASKDGATWYPTVPLIGGGVAGGFNKPFYSSVDQAAVFAGGVFAKSRTDIRLGPWLGGYTAGTFPTVAVTQDTVNDRYVLVGGRGVVVTLTRAYDKTTQFMLPAKSGTWIKATV